MRALTLICSAAAAATQMLICMNSARTEDVDCTAYISAVKSDTSGTVPIIPDSLLSNTETATVCLIRALESLKEGAQVVNLQGSVRTQFLAATGGLRAIISKLNFDDEKSGSGDGLTTFDEIFRKHVSIPIISILTYGARNETYEVRSNSLLILANVIDNSTVCIPLNHLWDREIGVMQKEYSVRGQANLLATVSVVAPWAYRENFDNIQKTKKYVSDKINANDPNMKQTVDILSNIQKRLDSQTTNTNKGVFLTPELKRLCVEYWRTGPQWAPRDQLTYERQSGR